MFSVLFSNKQYFPNYVDKLATIHFRKSVPRLSFCALACTDYIFVPGSDFRKWPMDLKRKKEARQHEKNAPHDIIIMKNASFYCRDICSKIFRNIT
jgi:hypothetical protein